MNQVINAVDLAKKVTLPAVIHDGGEDRTVVAARISSISRRVYLTLESGEEIDVPPGCHLTLVEME